MRPFRIRTPSAGSLVRLSRGSIEAPAGSLRPAPHAGAGCAEGVDVVGAAQVAERQRLVAQAMTFLEQQQPVLLQQFRRCVNAVRDLSRARHRQQEAVVEKTKRLDGGILDRKRQQEKIEAPVKQFPQQELGLRLPQAELEVRIRLADRR